MGETEADARRKMVALYAQGLSMNEISKQFNCNITSVYKWVGRYKKIGSFGMSGGTSFSERNLILAMIRRNCLHDAKQHQNEVASFRKTIAKLKNCNRYLESKLAKFECDKSEVSAANLPSMEEDGPIDEKLQNGAAEHSEENQHSINMQLQIGKNVGDKVDDEKCESLDQLMTENALVKPENLSLNLKHLQDLNTIGELRLSNCKLQKKLAIIEREKQCMQTTIDTQLRRNGLRESKIREKLTSVEEENRNLKRILGAAQRDHLHGLNTNSKLEKKLTSVEKENRNMKRVLDAVQRDHLNGLKTIRKLEEKLTSFAQQQQCMQTMLDAVRKSNGELQLQIASFNEDANHIKKFKEALHLFKTNCRNYFNYEMDGIEVHVEIHPIDHNNSSDMMEHVQTVEQQLREENVQHANDDKVVDECHLRSFQRALHLFQTTCCNRFTFTMNKMKIQLQIETNDELPDDDLGTMKVRKEEEEEREELAFYKP